MATNIGAEIMGGASAANNTPSVMSAVKLASIAREYMASGTTMYRMHIPVMSNPGRLIARISLSKSIFSVAKTMRMKSMGITDGSNRDPTAGNNTPSIAPSMVTSPRCFLAFCSNIRRPDWMAFVCAFKKVPFVMCA